MLPKNYSLSPLPVYEQLKHQTRYRPGGNLFTGLVTPRTALLPVQFVIPAIPGQALVSWHLISLDDESVEIALPLNEVQRHCSEDYYWITYDGDLLDETKELCGLHYAVFVLNTGTYYSEVMNLKAIRDRIVIDITIEGCSENGGNLTFMPVPYISYAYTSYAVQLNVLGTWTDFDPITVPTADENTTFQIVVQHEHGEDIYLFDAEWAELTPCDITITDITND